MDLDLSFCFGKNSSFVRNWIRNVHTENANERILKWEYLEQHHYSYFILVKPWWWWYQGFRNQFIIFFRILKQSPEIKAENFSKWWSGESSYSNITGDWAGLRKTSGRIIRLYFGNINWWYACVGCLERAHLKRYSTFLFEAKRRVFPGKETVFRDSTWILLERIIWRK